jgi:RNA polymerase sigma-70 factor (ECF subfamily)
MDDEQAVYEVHASDDAQPSDVADTAIKSRLLQAALDQLNEDQRTAIMLHDVEGYSLQELQQILDVSQGTLKSRLSRARAKLRELLQIMEPDMHLPRVSN